MQLADKVCRKLYYTYAGGSLYDVGTYKSMQPQQLSELMQKHKIGIADSLLPLPIDPETVLSFSVRAANVKLVEYLCRNAKKEDLNRVCVYWSAERDVGLNCSQDFSLVNVCLSLPLEKETAVQRIAILKILLVNGANANGLKSQPLWPAASSAISRALTKRAYEEACLLCEYGAELSHLSPAHKNRLKKALWHSYGKIFILQTSLPFCMDLIKHIQQIFLSLIAPQHREIA